MLAQIDRILEVRADRILSVFRRQLDSKLANIAEFNILLSHSRDDKNMKEIIDACVSYRTSDNP